MKTIAVLRSNPKDAAFGRVCMSLAKEYRVICLVWDRQGDFRPFSKQKNIRFLTFSLHAGFHDLFTLLKLMLFQSWLIGRLLLLRCDAVHAIDLDTGFPGLLAAMLKRKHLIYQCLDPYYAALPPRWPVFLGRLARWLENTVISAADLFLISDILRLPQHVGAKPKKLVELANVPSEKISPSPRNRMENFIVGYIGSLVAGRNLDTIVASCANMAAEDVRLVIGGFGSLAGHIKKMAEAQPNVEFYPWLPYGELLKLEASFDLFLHITDPENEAQKWVSPNKLFESMAFARPIIVAKGTLAARRVRAIGNGLVVPYGDRLALQEAIHSLKANPDRSREMGRKGRREYERNWQPEIMEMRLLNAYSSLWSVS